MKILALEFSSEQRSVAIDDIPPGRPLDWAQLTLVTESGPRGLKPMVLIDTALRESHLTPAQIDCLAVGLGPGSYTGIRVAISVAQGWQLARGVKLVGVSSVECLAAQAQQEGLAGQIAIIIDAQRNEFYLAVYEMLANERRMIEPLHLATFDEVKNRIQNCKSVIGPEVNRWFPEGRVEFPDASMLAQLAAQKNQFVSGEQLEPIYLRETSFVKAPPPRKIS
jgi:tRNA threonylcarbamoyl adenosine modification protein YeaZ